MNAPGVIRMVLGVAAVAASGHSVLQVQQDPRPTDAKDVGSAVPRKVAKLISWPTPQEQARKIVPRDAPEGAASARRHTIYWINTIISPQWLPVSPEETLTPKVVLLKNAFDGFPVSYLEWEKGGYCFRASQTRTVIYIGVTPTQGRIAEGDVTALRAASRKLTSKLVNDIAEVKVRDGGADVNVAVGGTRAIMMRNCFDAAMVKRFGDGIVAQPARIDLKDKRDSSREHFWWGLMGWWTDGRTLGLFTIKADFSQWDPCYNADELDKYWLTPERQWQSKSRRNAEKMPATKSGESKGNG